MPASRRRPRALPMGKHIAYSAADHDYAAYYDGQLLGYRATRIEAEELADGYVYELLRCGALVLAGDLAPAGA